MAEKKLSYKEKVKNIENDKKIGDKDKAILELIKSELKNLGNDESKIKFLRDDVSNGHRKKFIGEPIKTFRIIDEKYGRQVEPVYFWVLGFLREQLGAKKIVKLVDTFSASEASQFHKNIGQALAGTQDRVVASLRNIATLIQHLFRIVRELSIITERLHLYYEGKRIGPEPKDGKSQNFAEMTLKDMYISLVEGGAKTPGSVLGLASQVGFATLPDFFYHTHIFMKEDVNDVINGIKGVNKKLLEVLGRKLRAYVGWRETSQKHLETRRKFMLSFLKQHFNSIKLNIEWVKPYLKQAKRMEMKESLKDSPDLLVAIEQAMLEIELMSIMKEDPDFNQVINTHIRFRTHPKSEYSQRQQGYTTSFSGRVELEFKARVMSNDQILAYKADLMKEDLDMLGYDDAIKEALDALGKEMMIYLEQADKDLPVEDAVKEAMKEKLKPEEEAKEKKGKEKEQKPWYYGADPFIQVFKGFKEIGEAFMPSSPVKISKRKLIPKYEMKKKEQEAQEGVVGSADKVYSIFKKAHGMLSW